MNNYPHHHGAFRPRLLLLLLILIMAGVGTGLHRSAAQEQPVPVRGPVYGVNFINSAEQFADEQQYENGLLTGAGWNRWPLYWFNIEKTPGTYDWSRQDTAVQADIAHGLQLNAILLGTPGFYQTGLTPAALPVHHAPRPGLLALQSPENATPQGLYEPVFLSGDAPGAENQINPDNKWALFVASAVARYKPGGNLAQQAGWADGVGITHWEMWNEPDLDMFWNSSLADYARLLKVGYLAAKHVDPEAQIMFGALANNYLKPDYYNDVLVIYDDDPLAADNGYYHDIFALHNYFYAWRSWYHTWRSERVMAAHGIAKDVWLNETGVPAWDDYPGPVWDPASPLRATQTEQADFAIQTTFYAAYAGADAIFHFQLYDGCGNQPGGTNFPPHNGDLCDANGEYNGKPCAGDANGLFRNPTDAACFSQHPQPETARANLTAFQLMTTYLQDVVPYWRARPGEPLDDPSCPTPGGPQEWIAFYQPEARMRVVGLWARCGVDVSAEIPATNPDGTARLVWPDGTIETISAEAGLYTIVLPAATNRNPFPGQSINDVFPIGGRPVILIEPDDKTVPELDQHIYLPFVTVP